MTKEVTKKNPYLEYEGDMIKLDDESVSTDFLIKLYEKKENKKKKEKEKKRS